jgi:hypothetical protein
MPEFFLDLFRTRNRLGDFLPQQLAKPVQRRLQDGLRPSAFSVAPNVVNPPIT